LVIGGEFAMTRFENPMTFVRSIKGAPASILWAFLFCRRSMTADELERWTGYADDNITKGIKVLIDTGWLVARGKRGPWCLADGRQLPLMEGLSLLDESEKIGLTGVNVVVDDLSLNSPTITTTTTTRDESDFFGLILETRTATELAALKVALDEFRIIGTKRAKLIECEWVDAAYVRASVKFAQDERCWDNPVGMAITRMLEHVEISAEHAKDCRCSECIKNKTDDFFRHKYVSGKYSDYIEH
jgi:hypothetical protein